MTGAETTAIGGEGVGCIERDVRNGAGAVEDVVAVVGDEGLLVGGVRSESGKEKSVKGAEPGEIGGGETDASSSEQSGGSSQVRHGSGVGVPLPREDPARTARLSQSGGKQQTLASRSRLASSES